MPKCQFIRHNDPNFQKKVHDFDLVVFDFDDSNSPTELLLRDFPTLHSIIRQCIKCNVLAPNRVIAKLRKIVGTQHQLRFTSVNPLKKSTFLANNLALFLDMELSTESPRKKTNYINNAHAIPTSTSIPNYKNTPINSNNNGKPLYGNNNSSINNNSQHTNYSDTNGKTILIPKLKLPDKEIAIDNDNLYGENNNNNLLRILAAEDNELNAQV